MDGYCEITIDTSDPQLQDVLIAKLSAEGYEGFEQTDTQLKAFIPENGFNAAALDALNNGSFTWKMTVIPKQNWNEVWESNFEPVQVGEFAGIRANFHPAFEKVEHDIVITPKMSFGTGHHATTYMMMQLMQEIDMAGKTVFDFGTGTGILAILAEKKGAKQVIAVDNDDWCIENSLENIQINHCSNIEVKKIDILAFDQKFDIILANINRNIILKNINILKEGLQKEGILLLSGLLEEDEKDIHDTCQSIGLQHLTTIKKSGWIAMRYF